MGKNKHHSLSAMNAKMTNELRMFQPGRMNPWIFEHGRNSNSLAFFAIPLFR